MAKKSVATFREKGAKGMAKVIRAVKSDKTGAYTFKEEMVSEDQVKDILSKK
jgi:hypothetical protein